MLGLGKKKPVAEYEAEGEIERVYHEIRQVLRVSGVNLNLRTWATFDKFLPAMWDALRPNLETRGFESAADRVRSDAVDAATVFPRLDAVASGTLGESQRFQLQRALNLYHYVNPKLLASVEWSPDSSESRARFGSYSGRVRSGARSPDLKLNGQRTFQFTARHHLLTTPPSPFPSRSSSADFGRRLFRAQRLSSP